MRIKQILVENMGWVYDMDGTIQEFIHPAKDGIRIKQKTKEGEREFNPSYVIVIQYYPEETTTMLEP